MHLYPRRVDALHPPMDTGRSAGRPRQRSEVIFCVSNVLLSHMIYLLVDNIIFFGIVVSFPNGALDQLSQSLL